MLISAASLHAAQTTVTVLDRDGNPVPGVAVYVDSAGDSSGHGKTAVMDQVDTRFVPHLLVVQKGTLVEFPNSDPIAHHVYSFSRPNDFQLPLYKGDAHEPVRFEDAGLVTLGCNIHDHMLAYILVVDGSEFGKTDALGQMHIDMQAGSRIHIWSPRIRQRGETLSLPIQDGDVVFQLNGKLRPPHDGDHGGVEWTDY
jgi:plastocyanin